MRELATRCPAVTALDRSAKMIALARETCAGLPNVAYVAGDLRQTDLSGPFDLVAAVAVIHHLDFAAALGRMASLLRPGGRLVVIGLARNASPVDWAFAAAGVPVHRALTARQGYWRHRAPIADPAMSWGEVRAVARQLLPGVRWRRLMLWRYALTWTKPAPA